MCKKALFTIDFFWPNYFFIRTLNVYEKKIKIFNEKDLCRIKCLDQPGTLPVGNIKSYKRWMGLKHINDLISI